MLDLITKTKLLHIRDAIGCNTSMLDTRLAEFFSLTLMYYPSWKLATKLNSSQLAHQVLPTRQLLSNFASLESQYHLISWRVALGYPMIWGTWSPGPTK